MTSPLFSFCSFAAKAPGIDAKAGVIRGVSLATVGPAKGHGVMCDETMLEQVRDCAAKYKGGLKVKMSHRGDVGDIVGTLRDLRLERGDTALQLLGDLHLLESSPSRAYVLEIAERMPDCFGLSIVFSGPTEERNGIRYQRCVEIYGCDLVDDPAANPTGLFSVKKVDAAGKETSPTMSDTEIKALIADGVAAVKTEFATALIALRTENEALKSQLNEYKAGETARVALVAQGVAKEFAKGFGTHNAPAAPNTGTPPADDPAKKALDDFDTALTTSFAASASKSIAWADAIRKHPAAHQAYLRSGRRPSFDPVPARIG